MPKAIVPASFRRWKARFPPLCRSRSGGALTRTLLTILEHHKERNQEQRGAHEDRLQSQRPYDAATRNRADGKAENYAVVKQAPLEVAAVPLVQIVNELLGAATQIANAHGCGKAVSVKLPKRLDLNAATQRGKAIRNKVKVIGDERDDNEKNHLDNKGYLAPMQVTLL